VAAKENRPPRRNPDRKHPIRGGPLVRKIVLVACAAVLALSTLPGHAEPELSVRPLNLPGRTAKMLSFGQRLSGNWAGYNLGFLSSGRKLFNQISGTWTVPTASKHTAGVDEYSVNWIGIGGGCVDQRCLVVDGSLIQAGSGQYIDSSGDRHYFGWYELIPGPILEIVNFVVNPGNRIYSQIKQPVAFSDVWTITLKNLSTGQTFKTTVPYSSTHLTAEWIEERPSVGGFPAPLPNLTNPRFNDARVNGASATFKVSDEVAMVEGSKRLATPSAPDPDKNGFNVCTYTTSCAAPSGA
jgi:peptidase A4-like protein